MDEGSYHRKSPTTYIKTWKVTHRGQLVIPIGWKSNNTSVSMHPLTVNSYLDQEKKNQNQKHQNP